MSPKFKIGTVVVHNGGVGVVTEIAFKRGVKVCKQSGQFVDDGKGVDIFYRLNGTSQSTYYVATNQYSIVGVEVRESDITGTVSVTPVKGN